MPKKRSITITPGQRKALSTRRWYELEISDITQPTQDTARFEFSVMDEPLQDGRVVAHEFPAVLDGGSGLLMFLKDALGIHPRDGEEFDLIPLIGKRVSAKFGRADNDGRQEIAEFGRSSTNKPAVGAVPTARISGANE